MSSSMMASISPFSFSQNDPWSVATSTRQGRSSIQTILVLVKDGEMMTRTKHTQDKKYYCRQETQSVLALLGSGLWPSSGL